VKFQNNQEHHWEQTIAPSLKMDTVVIIGQ